MNLELAEAAADGDMLLVVELLLAEYQDRVLEKGVVDAREAVVFQRLR